MITREFAEHFASEWIAAWNAHDLSAVLSHYSDDFEMSSPFIVQISGEPSGTLKGKAEVRAYWRTALAKIADLRFELLEVCVGVNSIALYYNAVLGKRAVEWFWFDESGKVTRAIAHYN